MSNTKYSVPTIDFLMEQPFTYSNKKVVIDEVLRVCMSVLHLVLVQYPVNRIPLSQSFKIYTQVQSR